MKYIV